MTALAITSVNGDATQVAHIVAYGATVSVALTSTVNVRTVTFSFVSDSNGATSFPSITPGTFGAASLVFPADPSTGAGWSFLLQTIVNENTTNQAIYRTILGVPGTAGVVPICPDETYERHPTLGWLHALYQLIGSGGSGGIGVLGSGNQIRPATIADITINQNMSMFTHRITDCVDPVNPQDVDTLHARSIAIAAITMDTIPPAFAISSFSLSGTNYAAVVEVGTTISSLVSAVTYVSGPPSVATITDTSSGAWTLGGPSYASGSRGGTVSSSTNNASCTVTLSATGPGGVRTATRTISWQPKVYRGPATPGTYNALFITSLATSVLLPSRVYSFTEVTGAGQYGFFAQPSAYGTPTFMYGILAGGWSQVASAVSVTSNGVTQNYDLYKTNQPNLGSTLWGVS
jgi:hypothetical protein